MKRKYIGVCVKDSMYGISIVQVDDSIPVELFVLVSKPHSANPTYFYQQALHSAFCFGLI
jgi:hypothetical protein